MKLNSVASRREFLKELSTSELDRMLQAELRKETIDDDLVRLVLSVLEEREKNYPVELNEEIAAAAEDFEGTMKMPRGVPTRKKLSPVLKAASILLVVGLLLFVAPQAVHAENFFEMLARWTDSIFEFFNPKEKVEPLEYVFETDHAGLQQIYDAVVELGIVDPVVPQWVPDGYILQYVHVLDQSTDTVVSAELMNSEKYIFFSIIIHDKEAYLSHEKDANNITIVELAGIQHYIMSNIDSQAVTWVTGKVECSIFTNCLKEELHSVLKSIYKAEE